MARPLVDPGRAGGTADARRIVVTRALRGFADGFVSVLLAGYLTRIGFTPFQVGAIVTGTLLGSAAVTMAVGLAGHRVDRRLVLLAACGLMFTTGIGFASLTTFGPLLVVAVLGTLNPSAGDVSVFLPTEQAALAQASAGARRTRVFATYNVAGNFSGAAGALAGALPAAVAHAHRFAPVIAERASFVLYALVAVLTAVVYLGLGRAVDARAAPGVRPLARSRRTVMHLAALFSLDSFGGGFVVQSLLVLWLYQRFQLSVELVAPIFFVAGTLGGLSQLASPAIAARIGLVRTMVYTHIPSNLFLVAAGLVPSAPVAIALLLLRASLSQMDVPVRQAFVMAVVAPEERAAAASVTNVPRSLAAAIPPLFVGVMLSHSPVGWPLVCGGILKLLYDLLLLAQFQAVQADAEE